MNLFLRIHTSPSFAITWRAPISLLVRALAMLTFLTANVSLLHAAAATATASPSFDLPDVTTYHNDENRTGWNARESILTPASVNASSFGLLATVPLDARVDSQPLLVGFQHIEGQGSHSVLYVATQNNTIYAIDALDGTILLQRNLGPRLAVTGACAHGAGIYSTPTIDAAAQTLFVMVATLSASGAPEYDLHALNLSTLSDRVGSPAVVSAAEAIDDGGQYSFDASTVLQRPALLETDGHIYAAFGSFGDCNGHNTRGWVLGWNAFTLAPMTNPALLNLQPQAGVSRVFLTAVWMSGYGLAADEHGSLYFTTGNTQPGTFDENGNVAESAIRLSKSLGQMIGSFTPSNEQALDVVDGDYSAGGMMVLPDQQGAFPHLAVAAGKDGRLFVLNRDRMGGFHATDYPNYVPIGPCWCGPSYFELSHQQLVVTSGGTNLSEWAITTEKNLPSLSLVASVPAAVETSHHDAGFFTSISSNGETPNTAIIWAVGHGTGSDNSITLHAFDATPRNGTLTPLWSGVAGVWPTFSSNPNVVPTVGLGHVYVASVNQVQIFGLLGKQCAVKATAPSR